MLVAPQAVSVAPIHIVEVDRPAPDPGRCDLPADADSILIVILSRQALRMAVSWEIVSSP